MKFCVTMTVFLFTLIVYSNISQAQITITSNDATAINEVGNVLTNHLDSTTTLVDIGSPGATSWDFSALNSHYSNSFTSVTPSSTPYYSSDFSSSNVAFTFTEFIEGVIADGWQYSTQNPGDYLMDGVVIKSAIGTDTFLIKSIYSPTQLLLPLPFTFDDQWGSVFTITNTTYYNGVPFTTIIANHTETVSVDAYGPMTMPGGTVLQALRVRRDDRYTSPSPPFYVRTISYSFMTKSGAVVEVVASDTSSPNSGTIQTDGVTWSSTNISGVEDENGIPAQYSLSQNYPNPFNPVTIIKYSIPAVETQNFASVQLKVYDVLGNEVATLVNEEKPAGSYEVKFNASQLSSGIYFYKLQAGNYSEMKKMILMK